MSEEFESAVKRSKELPEKPSNDILLKIYSLYKQATEGDINIERPIGFDFKALAKYNAWKELKGLEKTEAEKQYIELINSLL